MFLTQKIYDLNNFLSALNFIAPRGTEVSYFITPRDEINLPENSGFQVQKVLDIPEDESITYVKQMPSQKQDQAITPTEYSVFDPGKLGRRIPTPNLLPPVTEPENLESPFIQTLSECKTFGTDLKLLEDYMMFPKNTIFHCIPSKLKEMEWRKNPGFIDSMMNDFHPATVKDHEIGDRWRGSFPAGVMEFKIQMDAWNLYKEGYTEEEIVDLMLQQKWYQKQMKRKSFGTREDLLAFVTDWVREKAENLNFRLKQDENSNESKARMHEGIFDEARARANSPEFAAKKKAYLEKKSLRAAAKAKAKENTYTFNQLAMMVPEGEEPEFIETRVPFEYDIRIGDKLYKKISSPSGKRDKFRLVEGASFLGMTTMAARSKSPLSSGIKKTEIKPTILKRDIRVTDGEIKDYLKKIDDGENTLNDIIRLLRFKFPGEPKFKLERIALKSRS
jgi:hypothetical protein